MAPITITALASSHLTPRAIVDPLTKIWPKYASSPIIGKVLLWLASLFIGAILVTFALGFAFLLHLLLGCWCIGLCGGVWGGVLWVVTGVGRRCFGLKRGVWEGEDARDVNVQVGRKEGNAEMGIIEMEGRNMGPQAMSMEMPPAYSP